MKSPLSVSIIINTLNRAELLDRTLTSLRQLRYRNFEALVVNGPSSDDTAKVLERHSGAVRVAVCAEANLSKSRNIGIAMARGDIVAFIDDDAVPEPDWLDRLLLGYEDPLVAAVGGYIRDHGGIEYQCKTVIADRFGDSKSYDSMDVQLDENRYLSLTGTNSSFRRKVLLEERGFDEEYAYFLDETDLNLRLVESGWKAVVVPDAEIHHKYAASHLRGTDKVPRSMYVTARSKAYFCCVNARKTRSLTQIVDYLANFINKERRWKRQMHFQRQIDQITCERLISEVEKGVVDGTRDAFSQASRQLLSPSLLSKHADEEFKPFPLPRPAKERLRICFLSADYPPVGNGGIGQWTREVAIGLAERGHEVTVIARSRQGHSYVDFCEGVWVHRVHPESAPEATILTHQPAPRLIVDYSATVLAEIRRIQPRRDFQVISGPIWDLEPLVALNESGIPTVVSLHTTFKLALPHKPEWLNNEHYRSKHVDLVIEKEKELFESAPFLLGNSRALVNDIQAEYGVDMSERLTIVPHGLPDLARGVAPYPKVPGEFRLLFVGRLELRKGADLVLAILPGLVARYPHLVVDIVGDDRIVVAGSTLRERFLKENRRNQALLDRVKFHGVVSREDLLRFYSSCDLTVTPSRYESFGLIFVEAMMFGKASIGIAVGGVSEVVTDGRDGVLIAKDDPAELSTRVSGLIENPELLAALGAEARRTFERKFHATHMIDALESYYSGIAGCDSAALPRAVAR